MALTVILMPAHLRLAQILGVYDRPDSLRKAHQAPILHCGGVVMVLAFAFALSLSPFFAPLGFFDESVIRALIIGGTFAAALGILDDLIDLKPSWKLLGQLFVGLYFWSQGLRIERLTGLEVLPLEALAPLSALLTALWFALLINGINMIDGMDGLAASVVLISALILTLLAGALYQPLPQVAALILAGICVGFLFFNAPPARVFMGDTGSHFLGTQLAAVSLLSSTKTSAALTLALPLLAVALPLFETAFAFFRRVAKGSHPFRGDRRHLHHRLLDLGLSPNRILATFCYLTGAFGVVAYVSLELSPGRALILVAGILGGMAILLSNLSAIERLRNTPENLTKVEGLILRTQDENSSRLDTKGNWKQFGPDAGTRET